MGSLTGVLYGLLAVFLGGWYFGKWTGNFALLLFILTVVTFAYWLAERLHDAWAQLALVKQLPHALALRHDLLLLASQTLDKHEQASDLPALAKQLEDLCQTRGLASGGWNMAVAVPDAQKPVAKPQTALKGSHA